MALLVNEIFHSIQGESLWAGLPCIFIRLTGCNLRCRYCDTQYAYEQGSAWELAAILEYLKDMACCRVTLTGGEPLLQRDTDTLIKDLIDRGYVVSLETNGSQDIASVDPRCIKIVDIKCPSSGMQSHNCKDNINSLHPEDQVKFVIADYDDFQFARITSTRLTEHLTASNILFSPVHDRLPAHRLAEWMLKENVDARLQIQLHKYLWPDIDRGV